MRCPGRRWLPPLLMVAAMLAGLPEPAGAESPEPAAPDQPAATTDERVRKAEILASERWRRAMFEFREWLETQPVYSPSQVRGIRADLDRRVAAMSSWEVEYLLETLDTKLRILESPRAIEAREWLARYLEAMTDRRRADLLAGVPSVLDLSAAELAVRLRQVEAARQAVEAHADRSRRTNRETAALVPRARDADAATRRRLERIRRGEAAFSPYRPQPVADPPFSDAVAGPPALMVGPWGVAFGIDVGAL
ncbi:MAG: hypothetical protein ACKO4Z_11585 [Planctomycetota bacterium]